MLETYQVTDILYQNEFVHVLEYAFCVPFEVHLLGCLIKLKVTFVTIVTLWMSWILRHTLQHLYLFVYYMNFPFNRVCGSPVNTILESNKHEYKCGCFCYKPKPYSSLWSLGTANIVLESNKLEYESGCFQLLYPSHTRVCGTRELYM